LAADRGSAPQIRKIVECFDAVDAALKRGDDAIAQDFALHCSIADATGNPQFRRFLEHLGRFIIPRQTIRDGPGMPKRTYSETFQREHRDIVQAIRGGAVLQARAAMRRHLVNSRKRYQRLAAKLGSN
jgi:GntR family transcriptional regulator, transcriptional repressor for pyruvate dehydrogenase complex